MPRELNPLLFGGEPNAQIQPTEVSIDSSPQHIDSVEAQVFSAQVEGLKERMVQMAQQIQLLEQKREEQGNVAQFKMERTQTTVRQFEALLKQHVSDMNSKFAQLVSRVNTQKMNESKVEQLVDRHSQLVQNFETKMLAMQKVISEQELRLMNYKSELEQARKELARLKRL